MTGHRFKAFEPPKGRTIHDNLTIIVQFSEFFNTHTSSYRKIVAKSRAGSALAEVWQSNIHLSEQLQHQEFVVYR